MGIFKKIKNVFKEAFLELKKVHWPTKKEARILTGAVLVITVLYALLLTGMDFGLAELLKVIIIK
ncbi:MAG: preprotein translocase subunit SecE [Candidatus Paceibacterota bacterium]|jgi:preprotein translocase subunit SecE